METIMVLEDDIELNDGISYALQREGYTVASARSVGEAKRVMERTAADLAVLDVNLPDGDGFFFCRWINELQKIPVLFLSARDLEEDMLKGYELGAQDYVTKPFSMKILLKKIEVILSRKEGREHKIFDDGFLRIDFASGAVSAAGKECSVTPTEFRLLKIFAGHQGQLLTYAVLLDRLWDEGAQFSDKHVLAVNVNRLRRKIEDADHSYITNIYGMGYLWKS